MTKRARRNHTPAFKAKVALAAVKGDKTLAELASSSMSIRTRSDSGGASCSTGRRLFSAPTRGRRRRRRAKLYADIRFVVETARRRSIRAIDAIRLTLEENQSIASLEPANRVGEQLHCLWLRGPSWSR